MTTRYGVVRWMNKRLRRVIVWAKRTTRRWRQFLFPANPVRRWLTVVALVMSLTAGLTQVPWKVIMQNFGEILLTATPAPAVLGPPQNLQATVINNQQVDLS